MPSWHSEVEKTVDLDSVRDLSNVQQRCVGRLQDRYVIKFEINEAGTHEKKGHFLGRTIRWTDHGLAYRGDETLLEGLLDERGVRSVSASQTLGEKTHSEVEKEGETWKTDATLKSFSVNAEKVRKLRCEF